MSRKRFTAEQIIGFITGSRCEAFPGQERRAGLSGDGDHGADLLPLAQGIRWDEDRSDEEAKGSGAGERPSQESGG